MKGAIVAHRPPPRAGEGGHAQHGGGGYATLTAGHLGETPSVASPMAPRHRPRSRGRSWSRLAFLLSLAVAGCGAKAQPEGRPDIVVTGTPVPLDSADPTRTRVGELTYAGGLHLSSPGAALFGGFSGLALRPDGRFLSQSDVGGLLEGRIVTDGAGRLAAVIDTRLTPLRDAEGRTFVHKSQADAEDITFVDEPGRPDAFAISFEGGLPQGLSRVSLYDRPEAPERTVYRATYADTALHLRPNESFEALTQCAGERTFLLGSEVGEIVRLDPATGRIENRNLSSPPPAGFKLTGLDCLPDGRIFALYRGFDAWYRWRAMVATLTFEPSRRGPVLRRRELARLDGSLTRDNMEGVAAVARPDGGVRLYIISDDNFGDIPEFIVGKQKTLLMAFDWTPPPGGR